MDETKQYEQFLRTRITQLRLEKNISEHRMSLELGKSGSYIRGITSGSSLPSVTEFFNICSYLEITPSEFFHPLLDNSDLRISLLEKLRELPKEDLEKVALFIEWIEK